MFKANKIIELVNNLKYGKSQAYFTIKNHDENCDLFHNLLENSLFFTFNLNFYYENEIAELNIMVMHNNDIWVRVFRRNAKNERYAITDYSVITKGKKQIKEAIQSKISLEVKRYKDRLSKKRKSNINFNNFSNTIIQGRL